MVTNSIAVVSQMDMVWTVWNTAEEPWLQSLEVHSLSLLYFSSPAGQLSFSTTFVTAVASREHLSTRRQILTFGDSEN